LKEGEKITLNIAGFNGQKNVTKPTGAMGGGLKKLAPPPGSKNK
jgi:hypothetical protein